MLLCFVLASFPKIWVITTLTIINDTLLVALVDWKSLLVVFVINWSFLFIRPPKRIWSFVSIFYFLRGRHFYTKRKFSRRKVFHTKMSIWYLFDGWRQGDPTPEKRVEFLLEKFKNFSPAFLRLQTCTYANMVEFSTRKSWLNRRFLRRRKCTSTTHSRTRCI